MKIACISLGCPKNQVDLDVMVHILLSAGHETVADLAEADVILVNTCGFIESAKTEAIENILEACSYFSPVRAFDDMTGGIEYFHFLEKTADAYSKDEKFRKELVRKLKETAEKLFAADNLMVGYTADEEGYKALPEELKKFKAALSSGPSKRYTFEFTPELKNEGFKTSSKVNYVARCGSFDAEASKASFLRILCQ